MGLRRGHDDIGSLRAVRLPLRNNLQVSELNFKRSFFALNGQYIFLGRL